FRGQARKLLAEELPAGGLVNLQIRLAEADGDHFLRRRMCLKETINLRERDAASAIDGKSLGPGADRWESNRANGVLGGQREGIAIARRQQLILLMFAAMPDRTDCVDHPFGRQLVP